MLRGRFSGAVGTALDASKLIGATRHPLLPLAAPDEIEKVERAKGPEK
jgi:hypothetical protein